MEERMRKKRLSIIIPIFNSEKYLCECLDSVLTCKNNDIEVILIDDGSTDNSYNICKDYQKKDNRIVLLQQKNAGVSRARNHGLEVAKGEYIGFVDSDDLLDENWYVILDLIKNCDIYYFSEKIPNCSKKEEIIRLITGYSNENICFAGPFSKILKKELLINNKIFFNEKLINGEDMLFNLNSILCCSSFKTIKKSFYNYRNFTGSATKRFDERIFKSDLSFQVELSNLDFDKKLKDDIITYNAQMAIYVLFQRLSYIDNYYDSKKYLYFLKNKPYANAINKNLLVNKKYHFVLYLCKMKCYYLVYLFFRILRCIKNKKNTFYFSKI